MTLYNVRTRVIGRLWAATAEGALIRHARLLRQCGHEVYPTGAEAQRDPTADRPTFVVRTPVVGLIRADTEDAALARHAHLLGECGHENVERGDAFESEPIENPDEFV